MGIRIVNGVIVNDDDPASAQRAAAGPSRGPAPAAPGGAAAGGLGALGGPTFGLADGPPDPTTNLPDLLVFGYRVKSVVAIIVVGVGMFMGWKAGLAAAGIAAMHTASQPENKASQPPPPPPSGTAGAQRTTYNGGQSGTLHESGGRPPHGGQWHARPQDDKPRFPGKAKKLSD